MKRAPLLDSWGGGGGVGRRWEVGSVWVVVGGGKVWVVGVSQKAGNLEIQSQPSPGRPRVGLQVVQRQFGEGIPQPPNETYKGDQGPTLGNTGAGALVVVTFKHSN